MALDELLRPFPVAITLAIPWGDMDAFQHVNNVAYFRYFEQARIAYIEALGDAELMAGTTIGPVLASISCRYRVPLTYPDTISVGVSVEALERDRFTMRQVVISHRRERVVAHGDALVVMYDFRTRRKTDIPDALRRRVEELQGAR